MNGQFPGRPILVAILIAALLLCGAGLIGLDGAIVRTALPSPDWLGAFVTLIDQATGKEVSNFLPGFVIVVVGGMAAALTRWKAQARLVLYVGSVQWLSTVVTDLSKPPFGRLRPFEAIEQGGADIWFVSANSFPSGHAGFYAGLVLPIVMLWPKVGVPLLLIPLLTAIQRVVSLDHYLSDVAASIAIAAALALLLRPIAGRAKLSLQEEPRIPATR